MRRRRRPSGVGRARKWTRLRPWRGVAPPADPTSSRATGSPSVPRTATASASSCTGAVTWDGVTVSPARPPASRRGPGVRGAVGVGAGDGAGAGAGAAGVRAWPAALPQAGAAPGSGLRAPGARPLPSRWAARVGAAVATS